MNKDFLRDYVGVAPLALAIERTMECEIFSKLPFQRPVLDIGCGDGIFAKVLFAEKIDTGIDPNAGELAQARNLGVYVELIECRGDAIPRPDAYYRTVFSNSVLEHIPQLSPVLKEARRLLTAGGMFYLTVPSDRFEQYAWVSRVLSFFRLPGLQKRFRSFYNRFWAHYHCYAPGLWERKLKEAGFEVVTVKTYAPNAICTLNDLLAPFGAFGFLLKRISGKWTLLPSARRILLPPVIGCIRGTLAGTDQRDGGLVFIAARKL